ncbi:MAG TPA: MASE1 domain-containing protein, partial [Cellvibrio sp.]
MSDRKKIYLLAKLPVLNLLFAVGYLALAQCGLVWSSLNSQVSLIWPAAGFALFGLLIFGLRIAPGLFIGAFATNFSIHLYPAFGISFTTFFAGTLVSGAMLLQAIIIARINDGILNRNLLVNLPRTLVFITSVFACALIAPSVGVSTFSYIGLVPDDELGKAWAFWWMGDSIGMLT